MKQTLINKLNGWERIGIILSCIWVICILCIVINEYRLVDKYRLEPINDRLDTLYSRARGVAIVADKLEEQRHREFWFIEWYNPKLEKYCKQYDACLKQCNTLYVKAESQENLFECWYLCETGEIQVSWISFLSVLLIPLIGVWISAYSLVWLIKWVIAGFSK